MGTDYVRGRGVWKEPAAGVEGSRMVFIGRDIGEKAVRELEEIGLELAEGVVRGPGV